MKKKWFKSALLIVGVMLMTAVFSACQSRTTGTTETAATTPQTQSSTETTTPDPVDEPAVEEPVVEEPVAEEPVVDEPKPPVDITWMSMLHTDSPPSDEVMNAINETFNINLTFNWVPDASKLEKLTTALASGQLADIVTLTQFENATVRGALASGMFWDIEPFLKDYPNLASISEGRLNSIRVDGKLYGVPMIKPVARYGTIVRQDWLDKLNLEVPKTVEDLLNVAVAFATQDPDGNGVNDTYGIIDRKDSFNLSFRMFAGWHGAHCYWGLSEDGTTVEPWFIQDSFFEAAEKYRSLYQQGAINSDFAVMEKTDQQQAIAQSKGGIVITGLMDTKNYVQIAQDIGMEGEMTWTMINDMTVGGGERRILSDTGNGVGGLYAIPKNYAKTEDRVRELLQFLNDLAGEDGFLLFTNGIEGTHWDYVDGVITIKDNTVWKQEVQALSSSRVSELLTYNYKSSNELTNQSNALIFDNEAYAVYDVSRELSSETYNTLWSQLLLIPTDAYFKYVMGNIDMETFKKTAIDEWKAAGGQKMIDEFTADYNRIYN